MIDCVVPGVETFIPWDGNLSLLVVVMIDGGLRKGGLSCVPRDYASQHDRRKCMIYTEDAVASHVRVARWWVVVLILCCLLLFALEIFSPRGGWAGMDMCGVRFVSRFVDRYAHIV